MFTIPSMRGRLVLIGIIVILSAGCPERQLKEWRKPQEFLRQEDAGSAHVAVLSVAPFEDYMAALQPNFKLSEDQALAAAVATTQASEDKLLDLLQIAGKIAPPTSALTSTDTKSTSQDQTTSTSESTKTTAPGNVSGISNATPSATTVPTGKSLADTTLGTDPMLKYWTATALYQEAGLLSRYVRDAVKRKGYDAYVVRLQISLMPAARNEPYDAYSTFSFFEGNTEPVPILLRWNWDNFVLGVPDTDTDVDSDDATLTSFVGAQGGAVPVVVADSDISPGGTPKRSSRSKVTLASQASAQSSGEAASWAFIQTPASPDSLFVVPLLVTDNLEASAQSAALDRVRQQAFSLAFLLSGFAGQADFVKYTNRLESVFGRDYNSLMTVARVTDNTYRVRLGALQQVGTSLAMVPRTNNATFLLLVPHKNSPPRISLVGRTTFVNAKTGQSLQFRTPHEVYATLDAIGDRYCRLHGLPYQRLRPNPISGVDEPCKIDDATTIDLRTLQALVQRNDLSSFQLALRTVLGASFAAFPAESLWVDLAGAMVGGQYSSTSFDLPPSKSPSLFCDQYGIVTDDGKKQATVTLRGGHELIADKLSAILVTDANAGVRLYSTGVQVRPGGSEVEFVFPSPKSLDKKYAGSPRARVEVICPDCGDPTPRCGTVHNLVSGVVYDAIVVPPTEDKKSVFQATAYSDAISLDHDKHGAIQLKLDLTDAAMAEAGDAVLKKPRTIALEVTGANVMAVAGCTPAVNPQNSFEFATDKRTELRITFDSLVAQKVVSVKIQEKVEAEKEKPTVAKGAPPKPTFLLIGEFHYSVVP